MQYIILYNEPISKSDEESMFKHKRLYKTVTTYLQSLYDKDVVEGGEDGLHDGLKPRTYAVDIAEGEGEIGAGADE